MKWIATNIRFPEDMYLDLKLRAALSRKSMAAIIRESVAKTEKLPSKRSSNDLLKRLEKVAKANAKAMKGKSLSKLLIKMRYEQ